MATYRGEAFVGEQLRSFAAQGCERVQLFVSDDSDNASTRDAISDTLTKLDPVDATIAAGPQSGFVENFRHLVLHSQPDSDFIAFSDQDDIWLPDKTTRSIAWLKKQPRGVPALYCGRTQMIDEAGRDTGRLSPLFPKAPAFKNALVQSIAGGNTMTMNRAAFDLIKRSFAHGAPVTHDWWAYLIVTGAGGRVYYDPQPLTLYRQHGRNLIGENQSPTARARRIKMIASGVWKRWQDTQLDLIDKNVSELTPDAQATLERFRSIRHASPLTRLTSLKRSDVWRQTNAGTAALYLAVLLNKF